MVHIKIGYYDPNDATPLGECIRCGGEIYDPEEDDICYRCRSELERYDQKTVEAVMEAFDGELEKYLSDDLRNEVWNAVAERYAV